MRFSTELRLAAVLLAPLVVSAAPFKRGLDGGSVTVLKFADVLEVAETQFYKQALAKFKASDFTYAGFASGDAAIQQITTIQSDESTHDTTLQTLLKQNGVSPIEGCTVDFSKALTDVSTLISTAGVVELTGVGAYLGAAHLVGDQHILTAAASIATIESRHSTILNMFRRGTAIPTPFDLPLGPNEVLAIVGQFIKGCDVAGDLGITANTPLTVTNTGTITSGTCLTFSSPAIYGNTNGWNCQILTPGQATATVLPITQCDVPKDVNGPLAIWITKDSTPLSGDVIDRQYQSIVAGPALVISDNTNDLTSDLIRLKL